MKAEILSSLYRSLKGRYLKKAFPEIFCKKDRMVYKRHEQVLYNTLPVFDHTEALCQRKKIEAFKLVLPSMRQ